MQDPAAGRLGHCRGPSQSMLHGYGTTPALVREASSRPPRPKGSCPCSSLTRTNTCMEHRVRRGGCAQAVPSLAAVPLIMVPCMHSTVATLSGHTPFPLSPISSWHLLLTHRPLCRKLIHSRSTCTHQSLTRGQHRGVRKEHVASGDFRAAPPYPSQSLGGIHCAQPQQCEARSTKTSTLLPRIFRGKDVLKDGGLQHPPCRPAI